MCARCSVLREGVLREGVPHSATREARAEQLGSGAQRIGVLVSSVHTLIRFDSHEQACGNLRSIGCRRRVAGSTRVGTAGRSSSVGKIPGRLVVSCFMSCSFGCATGCGLEETLRGACMLRVAGSTRAGTASRSLSAGYPKRCWSAAAACVLREGVSLCSSRSSCRAARQRCPGARIGVPERVSGSTRAATAGSPLFERRGTRSAARVPLRFTGVRKVLWLLRRCRQRCRQNTSLA